MVTTIVNVILRRILFIQRPRISREKAQEIAFQKCKKENIEWNPFVREELRAWIIVTPKNMRGGQTYIKIDQQNGKIISMHTTPL